MTWTWDGSSPLSGGGWSGASGVRGASEYGCASDLVRSEIEAQRDDVVHLYTYASAAARTGEHWRQALTRCVRAEGALIAAAHSAARSGAWDVREPEIMARQRIATARKQFVGQLRPALDRQRDGSIRHRLARAGWDPVELLADARAAALEWCAWRVDSYTPKRGGGLYYDDGGTGDAYGSDGTPAALAECVWMAWLGAHVRARVAVGHGERLAAERVDAGRREAGRWNVA